MTRTVPVPVRGGDPVIRENGDENEMETFKLVLMNYGEECLRNTGEWSGSGNLCRSEQAIEHNLLC